MGLHQKTKKGKRMQEKKRHRVYIRVTVFLELLTLLLIVLKITEIIQLSWAMVFAPIWIPLLIAGIVLLVKD